MRQTRCDISPWLMVASQESSARALPSSIARRRFSGIFVRDQIARKSRTVNSQTFVLISFIRFYRCPMEKKRKRERGERKREGYSVKTGLPDAKRWSFWSLSRERITAKRFVYSVANLYKFRTPSIWRARVDAIFVAFTRGKHDAIRSPVAFCSRFAEIK